MERSLRSTALTESARWYLVPSCSVFVAIAQTDFSCGHTANPGGAAHTPFPSPSESSTPKNFLGSAFLSHHPFPHLVKIHGRNRLIPLFSHNNTVGISSPHGFLIQGIEIYISTLPLLIAKTLDRASLASFTTPSCSRSPCSVFPCGNPPHTLSGLKSHLHADHSIPSSPLRSFFFFLLFSDRYGLDHEERTDYHLILPAPTRRI